MAISSSVVITPITTTPAAPSASNVGEPNYVIVWLGTPITTDRAVAPAGGFQERQGLTAPILHISKTYRPRTPASPLTRIPAGIREIAWHTVPEPNPVVRLDGSVEYETRDGEVGHVRLGSLVLVADKHGEGHLSVN
jgi:hypothetical protein